MVFIPIQNRARQILKTISPSKHLWTRSNFYWRANESLDTIASASEQMRFSKFHNLGKTQAELDFVDVDTSRDMPVFVDPYAIEIKDDQWSGRCADHIRSFFAAVIDAIRNQNYQRALHLLSHLHEARETYLGVSRGPPDGRGIGRGHAEQLFNALRESRAVETGVLSDLAEAELFIAGIGRDKISDLTTNIIRHPLVEYTKEQCDLLNIPVSIVHLAAPVWDPVLENWRSLPQALPHVDRKPVLLVPKYSVRRKLSLDSQEFYNHQMVEFLAEEYLVAGSSLVHVFQNGSAPRVYKKDVKERHPFSKNNLADFVRKNPEVLREYKALKGAQGPLTIEDFEEDFDEAAFALALAGLLAQIPPGNADASRYHSFMIGVLSFLFYPGLIQPVKENEIHEGRKRIDIKYTNAGQGSFFDRILSAQQTRAISVSVECKNYSSDPANPEFDQLSGRFSHTRGFFGFLCCRGLVDAQKTFKTCRDTAHDGRGYMIVLDDQEIGRLLQLISEGRRESINSSLNGLLNKLVD